MKKIFSFQSKSVVPKRSLKVHEAPRGNNNNVNRVSDVKAIRKLVSAADTLTANLSSLQAEV